MMEAERQMLLALISMSSEIVRRISSLRKCSRRKFGMSHGLVVPYNRMLGIQDLA